mmetsp:Transcript_19255/g.36896  ORF Transcript_19255/g.36896 Transcript_19255/m.36896 type:complete len:236 (-) Transcript_19255:377-1084(-)
MASSSVANTLNMGLEGDPNALLTCQHIGCNSKYTIANNPPGCCVFHPGAPVFHDGMKEWSCCGAKSHDFGLFMDIKGCASGSHTQEKPEKPAPSPNAPVAAPTPITRGALASGPADPVKASCPRCSQGFFCSDHQAPAGVKVAGFMTQSPPIKPSPKEVKQVGPHEEQLCKHKGCGLRFKEANNTDTSCRYHPGPPVFHERKKGWSCCNVHVYDFDEFMSVPTCTTGRHSAIDDE